ncbi:MAG: hypothetical protein AAB354_13035 [candidate division KSB1 bacterium]
MGGRRPTLPHAEVAALINGHRERDEYVLSALQQEEPVYQTLFELIALCQKQAHRTRPEPRHDNAPQTFFGIEQLLLRIYAGNATSEEAAQLLGGLQNSPIFYRRLLTKLEALTPELVWEEAEALEGITIKSDEEVLALVRMASDPVEPREPWGARTWQALAAVMLGVLHASAQVMDFLLGHRAIAVGLPLLLIASLTVFQIGFGADDFTERTPYDYQGPILRGSSYSDAADLQFIDFSDTFLSAITDYLLRDYSTALQKFESLEPQAAALHSNLKHEKYASLLRDYYFYAGLSHFALSHKKSFFRGENRAHAAQAVMWLARADSLAQGRDFPERETYFLGLAYDCNNQRAQAISELKKIPAHSEFYAESGARIKEWSNP